MRTIKRKIIVAVMCTMVLTISGMLAGCTININSDTDKSGTPTPQKQPSPTVRPTQTPKPSQQTENSGKVQGNNQNPTQSDQNSSGGNTSDEYDSTDNQDSDDNAVKFESRLGDEAILHSPDGEDVTVTRGDDGEFYDENGVLYPDLDEASIYNDLVINENGESFYWGPSNKEGDPVIPSQTASQAMMYKPDGESVLIRRSDDGNWYDENGISFGDVEDAQIAGDPVTNENGDTYYWTIPE